MYRWPRPAAADAPTSRSYPLPPAPFPRPATLASEPLPGHAALAPELLLRPALLAPAREEPVVWTPPEEPRFAYPPLTFGGQMREDLSNGEQFVQDGCNGGQHVATPIDGGKNMCTDRKEFTTGTSNQIDRLSSMQKAERRCPSRTNDGGRQRRRQAIATGRVQETDEINGTIRRGSRFENKAYILASLLDYPIKLDRFLSLQRGYNLHI
ncbi:uncharacterized protein LOC120687637 [Panicum virgatum]|uniref:uncharacterized protein LOC120687637 n=1 Tax=Panicum virgatum TaxID=38727 RepID=UPI0019D5DE9A|nr:uncharacterized protein LOC120687637 [Panicum virgatum]